MRVLAHCKPINPFYAARQQPAGPRRRDADSLTYVRLPRIPVTSSPVPHLTSLYHFSRAGEYGSRAYPGNCGGNLIKDLLLYFRPASVLDPMTGSGTCQDVCRKLATPCWSNDLHQGVDACDPTTLPSDFEFCWLHPPYWRQKLYTDDPRDLSRAATLEAFLRGYQQLIENCAAALAPGGRVAILMGDYSDRQAGFVPSSTTQNGLPSRPGCASVAPTSFVSVTGPAAVARCIARPSSPGCTTCVPCSRRQHDRPRFDPR